MTRCHADRDGDCTHADCPQLRDGEPHATGRHCPLDVDDTECPECHGVGTDKWCDGLLPVPSLPGGATAMTTVIAIIAAHLREIGADGLVCPDAECGCELSDLAPCAGDFGGCQPGWKGLPACEDHGEWTMFTSKDSTRTIDIDT